MEAITEGTLGTESTKRLNDTIEKLVDAAKTPLETAAQKVEAGTFRFADESGIATDLDHERLELIYQGLLTAPSCQVIDDLNFMYLLVQRALVHEMDLRKTLDQMQDKMMSVIRATMLHGKERNSYRG